MVTCLITTPARARKGEGARFHLRKEKAEEEEKKKEGGGGGEVKNYIRKKR